MANFIKTYSSFAHGEVAPDFYATDNINGLSRLVNMDVTAGGGLTRRAGLRPICTVSDGARLIPFSVSETENYILVLSDGQLIVMQGDQMVYSMVAYWPADALAGLQYAQRFNTMIFVHPQHRPYILRKQGRAFRLAPFDFESDHSNMTAKMPFIRFADSENVQITILSNAMGNNYATLQTDRDYWTPDSVGVLLSMCDTQWLIHSYIDAKNVVALVNTGYSVPSTPITNWREAAFSPQRGWPCSITFHQDRLVFGGSRDYPAGVWMSQVGNHDNFDVGTGLDDAAIFITLLSDRRQQICTVVSSDNLQILTTTGEWAISSKPLTPSSVDIKQHTSVGSIAARYLPTQKIDGQTVFISATGCDIRELSLDDLGEHYNANDLCAYAKHMMNSPVDIAYNDHAHQLFVIMSDGQMAVLNQNAALGISAWSRYQTSGKFKSVAVSGGKTYVVVSRDDGDYLEQFDRDTLTDNARPFAFMATPLPLHPSGHNTKRVRVRKVTARVMNTGGIFINGHRATLPNEIYSTTSGYTGDVSITQLGTSTNYTTPLWRIHGSDSLPVTVLSVTVYVHYTI